MYDMFQRHVMGIIAAQFVWEPKRMMCFTLWPQWRMHKGMSMAGKAMEKEIPSENASWESRRRRRIPAETNTQKYAVDY